MQVKFRYFIVVAFFGILLSLIAHAQAPGTIYQLSPWTVIGGYVKTSSTTAQLWIPGLASANLCLKTDATGKVTTGSCGTGGVSSLSPWATTTSSVAGQLNVYPLNTTDILNIGGTGTTTSRFWVDPNTSTAVLNGANTASVFSVGSPNNEWSLGTSDADKSFRIASSSNQIENINAPFAISKIGYVGIGTTSPAKQLTLQQTADDNGIALYGYDDRAGSYGHFYIDSSGRTNLTTSGNSVFTFGGDALLDFVTDMYISLGDTAGARKLYIRDSSNANQFTVDSDGNAYAAGNVGIGTTSPYAKLSVAGPVVGQYFTATDTASYSTFAGRVGLGTTTPDSSMSINSYLGSALLHVGDDSTNSAINRVLIENRWTGEDNFALLVRRNVLSPALAVLGNLNSAFGTTTSYARLTVMGSGATNATKNLELVNSASTTLMSVFNDGSVSVGTAGNATGQFMVTKGDGASTFSNAAIAFGYNGTNQYSHYIHTRHNAGSTANNAIDFYTSNGTAAGVYPTNAVHGITITDGKLGVGTTTPYAKLSVAGPIVGQYFTATSTTDSSTFAGNVGLGISPVYTNGIFSIRNSSDAGYIALTRAGQSSWSIRLDSTGALGIWDADGSNYPLYIVSSADTYGGNVGIGTTSPYAKLSVAGDLVAGVITATSSTSTFAGITTTGLAITGTGTTTAGNGINITSGCYAVNGVCLTPGVGGGTTEPISWLNNGTVTWASSTAAAPSFNGTSTTATSSLYHLSGSYISGFGLSSCIGTGNKVTYADGTFRCEADQTGGAPGGTYYSGWATTTSSVLGQWNIAPLENTTILNIGGTGTTTSKFWFDPNTSQAQFTGGNGTSSMVVGTNNNEWVIGTSDNDKSLRIASSTGLLDGATSQFSLSKSGVLTVGYASSTAQTITNLFTGTIAAGGTGSGVLGGTGMSGNIVTNVDDGNTTKVEFATRRAENTTASLGSKLFLGRQRGTLASPSVITTGDNLYTINGYGYDGTDYAIATAITSSVENTPTANIIPGLLAFSTANTNGTLTEAMRIYPNQAVFIGTTSATTTRNTLTVDGDIYRTWQSAELNFGQANSTSITGDTNFMGGFTFDEDNAGALTATNIQGSGYYRYTPGATLGAAAATAGDGAIIGLGRSFMTLATSTPRTEFTLRALWPSGATTSVLYLVGLWNVDHNGDTVSTSTPGCGFVASSTPNWKAMCMTSGAAYTVLDTGLATTTTAAQFTRFRVESNGTTVYFYYNVPGGSETLAATISTNLPTAAQMLRPMASVGRPQATTAGTQAEIQLMRAYASWRQPQY